jgi:DNA repair protein RecO (recombination protein O)
MRFELACLRELGLMPALQRCVGCGADVGAGETPVAFGLATGGVLCDSCRAGSAHVRTIPREALGVLRVLAEPGRAWREVDPGPEAWSAARQVLGQIMAGHLGRPPRMLPYLESGVRAAFSPSP